MFQKGVDDTKLIDIEIVGDAIDEWDITRQQDDMFFIQLSKPSANATLVKSRGTITLVDDDHRDAGVQYLSAVTDSLGSGLNDGRNQLQWRVPANSGFRRRTSRSAGMSDRPAIRQTIRQRPRVGPSCSAGARRNSSSRTRTWWYQDLRYSVFTLYPAVSAESAGRDATFDS